MAETPTTQIELGFNAPDFSLPDTVSGQTLSFDQVKGEMGTLVMFICNHCPFVVHVIDQLALMATDYASKGIRLVAISSNDVINYPQDGPDLMKEFAKKSGFTFPYLYDESQEVAKEYDAACTPDFSVFNAKGECVYRGQMDDSRPGNGKAVDGHSIRTVFDQLSSGMIVPIENQRPSIGCNIKWK